MKSFNSYSLLRTSTSLTRQAFSTKRKVDPFGGINLKEPVPNPNRLVGKYALITGGSNGIGRASCELFGKSGVSGLMIADLDENNGKLLAEKLNEERKSQFAFFVKADMSDKNLIKNMFEEHMKRFGKLNVLFNNAGIMDGNDDGPVNTEEDVWDKTIAINLKSMFWCHKFGIPFMLNSGGGSIINVASLVATMGSATPQLAYTASKGGVLAMSREMAMIYARDNLRINALSPGPIRTDLLMKFLNTEEKLSRRLVHIPIGRFGETKEIAQAVAFLASDESSFITGSNFIVDGGITQAYVTPE
jgi:NAD(P)-dependent dehydrogenase (short-subunit alcohol dehydrogenase family)